MLRMLSLSREYIIQTELTVSVEPVFFDSVYFVHSVKKSKFARGLKFRDNERPFLRAFMKPQVEIYDTTLRDGSQGEGINFSVADKLRIAEKLDAFGVHYIEGGWPGSNPKDIEFFAQAKKKNGMTKSE